MRLPTQEFRAKRGHAFFVAGSYASQNAAKKEVRSKGEKRMREEEDARVMARLGGRARLREGSHATVRATILSARGWPAGKKTARLELKKKMKKQQRSRLRQN